MKFSTLTPAQLEAGEARMQPHGDMPQSTKAKATEEAAIPELTRRAEWLNEEKKVRLGGGSGAMPRKALLSIYRGHTSSVLVSSVHVLEKREFLFTGSSDYTARMVNIATGRTIRVFEGHEGAVSSVCVHEITGSYRQVAETRHLIQTLNPVWDDPDEDVFEFELTSTDKVINVRCFDWDKVGQHDFIGSIDLRLEEDILRGQAAKNPVVTAWYPLSYQGRSGRRGKLRIQFRWSHRFHKLHIRLVAGKDLPRMDQFGYCDPYVTFKITDRPVSRLFTGSFDTTARMWDLKTGKVILGFAQHDRQITKICCADVLSTHCLFTASLDQTVLVWDIMTGSMMKRLMLNSPVTCVSVYSVVIDEEPDVELDQIVVPAMIEIQASYEYDHVHDLRKLMVDVIRAKDLPVMDSRGLCDPFVTLTLNDVQKRTKIVKNSLHPEFKEQFEFLDFTFDMELIVKVYDHDMGGKPSYIGNCAVHLEPLKNAGVILKWLEVNHTPHKMVYLFTGSGDKKVRMYDVRVGTVLKDFTGHTGTITDVQLYEVGGDTQLFSSSVDGTVKLWNLKSPHNHVINAVKTWHAPAGVTSVRPMMIADMVRIFASCQDSILYMWTLPAAAMFVDDSWRSQMGKFINSLPVMFTVLLFIVIDLSSGIYFEVQAEEEKDCKGRDSILAMGITWVVMMVFFVELMCQMLSQGRRYFNWSNKMNYFDLFVVGFSLLGAFVKTVLDFTILNAVDRNGDWVPPVATMANNPYVCEVDASNLEAIKITQKTATGIRVARVMSKILTGIRILRALAKAARIARLLGGVGGKKFQGHDRFLTDVAILPPRRNYGDDSIWSWLFPKGGVVMEEEETLHEEEVQVVKARSTFIDTQAKGKSKRTMMTERKEKKEVELHHRSLAGKLNSWRADYEDKWRAFSASGDNTVIMWDVMGTEIRIDREKNFVDAEVAGMSLAGDKTSAQV